MSTGHEEGKMIGGGGMEEWEDGGEQYECRGVKMELWGDKVTH